MFSWLFEERDETLDFGDGIFVRFFRAGRVIEDRVDQDSDGLGDAVENEELIRDQKNHRGRAEFVFGRTRHNGLNIVDKFVADEPDGATREARKSGDSDGAILLHHALDDFESVFDGMDIPLSPESHLTPALSPTSWRRGRCALHSESLNNFSVLD